MWPSQPEGYELRIYRKALALAGAVTLAGGLALTAGAAGASSTSTQDGMAGYFGNTLGTNYKSMIATFDLTPNAENIGTTTSLASPQGALGEQLCANGTGQAAELGVTYNGKVNNVGTFSVDYALGKLPTTPNADLCLNGILHNGNKLHPLLGNIAEGDSVTVLEQTGHFGVWFSAQDDSTGRSFETWASCGGWWTHSANWRNWRWHWDGCPSWNEPGAGVQQNLTLLGGAATGDLVDFTGVKVDKKETASPGTALGATSINDIAVDSSGTGNAPWLVGPAFDVTHGPNGINEVCGASLTTTLQSPNLTDPPLPSVGNQYGPLLASGSQFSVCAAAPIGA